MAVEVLEAEVVSEVEEEASVEAEVASEAEEEASAVEEVSAFQIFKSFIGFEMGPPEYVE